jgi:hypothetical protein
VLVRAAGLEPAQRLLTEGFSYPLRLSPPELCTIVPSPVWGLDYTFTIARRAVGAARLVSTPSLARCAEGLARDCLLPVSPSLSSSTPRVSPRALNLLSPLRLPIPPRPLLLPNQTLSAFAGEVELACSPAEHILCFK